MIDGEKFFREEMKTQMKIYNKTFELKEINNKQDNIIEVMNTTSKNIITNNIITNNLGFLTNNIFMKNILPDLISKKKLLTWIGLPSKFDEVNNFGKWWRFHDSCIVLCNLLVMILALYDYEINFTYPRNVISDYNKIRISMVMISMISIFFVIKRHQNKVKWQNSEFNDIEDFFSAFLFKKKKLFKAGLIVDLIINLLIPYPYLDFKKEISEIDRDKSEYIKIEYLLSDLLYILVIVRMIYLIRATINYSIFTDYYANNIAKEFDIKCNIRFAIKCILKTEHFKVVFLFIVSSIILLGFSLRVVERPYWAFKQRMEFEFLSNSFWVIFITMLTIGYGDITPMTSFGKLICSIAALWGTFICSMFVVCLYGLLDLSNDQFSVFVHIMKSRLAVKFIEDAYVLRKSKRNQIKSNYDELVKSFQSYKNMRNESKSIYRCNGLLHYNLKLLNKMRKMHIKFDKLEMDLESLSEYQK